MKPGGTNLSPKQLRAIDALLRETRIEEAAKAAGVGRTTLWRWLNEPEFSRAYKAARAQALEATLTALQAASVDAVGVLRAVLFEREAKPGEKVSAARAILEYALRGRDSLEIAERITALEQRAEGGENKCA